METQTKKTDEEFHRSIVEFKDLSYEAESDSNTWGRKYERRINKK